MNHADPGPAPDTLILGSADVVAAFDWSEAITALRRQYGAMMREDMFPPRTMARGDGVWLRTLSGVSPDGAIMGAKMIAASLSARRASYLIPLFDQRTADLLALIDGNAITGYRTAATTALALDALAPAGPVTLGVLGAGFEARNHVEALHAVREISEVSVFSPNPVSRVAFAQHLEPLGLRVRPLESAREVVGAEPTMLLCAARSRDEQPLFDGTWLRAGMTVASIGSTLPEQREVDPETIRRAALIVADMPEEVAHDTGDMHAARDAGVSFKDKLVSLSDMISGAAAGRRTPEDIVLYKSVGAALQDLTVAAMCLERASALGLGRSIPAVIQAAQK
ncbi:ornithine cyclodeaminase family protein [Roseomonas mucosa]